MTGSGGIGFVGDTATLFLLLLGMGALGGIWLWLRKRTAKKR